MIVSVFCTGPSVDTMSEDELMLIRANTLTYGINYFNRFEPDGRFFLDKPVAEWLVKRINKGDQIGKPITKGNRLQAYKELIDAGGMSIKCAHPYTFCTMLDYVYEYHKDDIILLFGADFTDYTVKTETGREVMLRENGDPIQKAQVDVVPNVVIGMQNGDKNRFSKMYNCNPESKLPVIQKADWRTFIK